MGTEQRSPCWLVVFWPFSEPRTGFGEDASTTKPAVIVRNDAVSVNTQSPKSDPIKTASVSLKITNFQYDQNIRPNDYMAVWMCNWESDIDAIVKYLVTGQGQQPNGFTSSL